MWNTGEKPHRQSSIVRSSYCMIWKTPNIGNRRVHPKHNKMRNRHTEHTERVIWCVDGWIYRKVLLLLLLPFAPRCLLVFFSPVFLLSIHIYPSFSHIYRIPNEILYVFHELCTYFSGTLCSLYCTGLFRIIVFTIQPPTVCNMFSLCILYTYWWICMRANTTFVCWIMCYTSCSSLLGVWCMYMCIILYGICEGTHHIFLFEHWTLNIYTLTHYFDWMCE